MAKIQHKNYIILEFSDIQNLYIKLCVGVVGYLYVSRMNKYKTSYVPSAFIRALSSHCKYDIMQHLITYGYVIQITTKKQYKTMFDRMIIANSGTIAKKEAYIYSIQNKLMQLQQVYLLNDKITKYIDEHLHLLNNQNFNHYNHSYKYIKFNIPYNIRIRYDIDVINTIDGFGNYQHKTYSINEFGYDNEFAGTHINIFAFKYPELLEYVSLPEPVLIKYLYAIPIILADQLLKTLGPNDYSRYFMKNRFKKSLFRDYNDYNIFNDIFYQQFYSAIFGYLHINEFKEKFPQAHSLLWRIKNGGTGPELPFIGFTQKFKPLILKTDIRLKLQDKHPALERGQAYYKIVPLVCMMRLNKIMRDVWRRLKKCDIQFIPLLSSVVISKYDEEATLYVFNDVINNHISQKLITPVQEEFVIKEKDFTFDDIIN